MKTAQKSLGILVGLTLVAVLALVGFGSGLGSRAVPPVTAGAVSSDSASGPQTTLLVRFGMADKEPAAWDGKIAVSSGKVERIEPWRFTNEDKIDGENWTISTRRMPPQSAAERERGADAMPMGDNGFFVTLSGCTAETMVHVSTKQGDFEAALADVTLGKRLKVLEGRVEIQVVPSNSKIISTPAEEDFPATAVGPDGMVYVAYLAFTHGKGFAVRPTINEAPHDFAFLAEPTGGDQLLLARFTPGKEVDAAGKWEEPLAVTQPGQDLYKPAVAVDGSGRVWVFWSANIDGDGKGSGNWDLMARRFADGKWSNPIRLTRNAGSDIAPAVATDSTGRVWVVWQAVRGTNSDILAAAQDGDKFGEPIIVSDASGNQWDPAIAISAKGQIAFAWDTYEKGDYDVHVRVFADGKLGQPIPVAATDRYEVRPSIAYDRNGRLWCGWEEAPEKWGKDFGAHEVDGWPLYRGHRVNVAVLSDGKLHRTSGDLTAALPASFEGRPGRAATAAAKQQATAKQQAAAKKKTVAQNAGAHDVRQDNRPPTSLPRLTADSTGRVWLAFRARTINTRATVGTIWHEFVSYYDGKEWTPAAMVPQSDALLDNRPAWAPLKNGQLLLVSSSDGRHASIQGLAPAGGAAQQQTTTKKQGGGQGKAKAKKAQESVARGVDVVNYDLTAAWMPMPGVAAGKPSLEPVENAKPEEVADYVAKERDDVNRIREFRTKIGGKDVRIVRGEFHRHTEISTDGGGDGTLQEMWRYALDAAAMDWIGNGDHDNGGGREYTWWLIQKTTDIFTIDGAFTPMYTYERSVGYPDGHRNVVFDRRGIRTLPRLQGGTGQAMDDEPGKPRPPTPDTQMLYGYLKHFGGVCASHTSGTNMGTDWRDTDPVAEPFVEVY